MVIHMAYKVLFEYLCRGGETPVVERLRVHYGAGWQTFKIKGEWSVSTWQSAKAAEPASLAGKLAYLPRIDDAAVAELADALALGASEVKLVRVQISPAAPLVRGCPP